MQVFSRQSIECVQNLQLPRKLGLIFINGRPRECPKHQNIQRKNKHHQKVTSSPPSNLVK